MTTTQKNLTEFDKILNSPEYSRENCRSKILWRACQILSNSVKFYKLEAEIFQLPSKESYVNLSSNLDEERPHLEHELRAAGASQDLAIQIGRY